MPKKRRRFPAEKKALSYAKDCRNSYGENDKASRKAIPARKAGENRKDRRKADQVLAVYETLNENTAEVAESSLLHDIERIGGWRKGSDEPLGEYLRFQQKKRAWRDGRKKASQASLANATDRDDAMEFWTSGPTRDD